MEFVILGISALTWKDINTIVEIDADEAEKLLKLIALLFHDWYVQREERAALYRDIIEIDQEKQKKRKG